MNYRQHKRELLYTVILISLSQTVKAMNGLPDPTKPADYLIETEPVFVEQVVEPGKKIVWSVSAIRISPTNRSAIVNGVLVREGDAISTATIEKINPLSVVIKDDEKNLIVRLVQNQVVKKYKHDGQSKPGESNEN